mgnify:CR=1 FL=1
MTDHKNFWSVWWEAPSWWEARGPGPLGPPLNPALACMQFMTRFVQRDQLVHPSGEVAALPSPLPVSPNHLSCDIN